MLTPRGGTCRTRVASQMPWAIDGNDQVAKHARNPLQTRPRIFRIVTTPVRIGPDVGRMASPKGQFESHLLMVPSSVSHGSLRRNLALLHAVLAVITEETPALWIERKKPMKKSLAAYTAAVALVALAMFA